MKKKKKLTQVQKLRVRIKELENLLAGKQRWGDALSEMLKAERTEKDRAVESLRRARRPWDDNKVTTLQSLVEAVLIESRRMEAANGELRLGRDCLLDMASRHTGNWPRPHREETNRS